MIKVVFFASVREAIGTPELAVEAGDITTVAGVIEALSGRGEAFKDALTAENLLVAVNQTMVPPTHRVTDGDEVAFFPPVTGG